MSAGIGLIFLMIVTPDFAPQFVLPMRDLAVCQANQTQLMAALDHKKLVPLCWDGSVQAFVGNPAHARRAPEGESIDEPPKPEKP